jgi:dihydrofolate reductase
MRCFIIAALSVDGYIAHNDEELAVTTPEDKKLFVRLTKEAGALVMGRRTFATIGRALPGRRNIIYTNHPESVTAEGVETTNETPTVLLKRLKSEGAEALAVCGGGQIYSLFMAAGVVNELYLTTVPVVFGQGIGLFSTPHDFNLELLDQEQLGPNTYVTHYRAKKSDGEN